MGFIWSDLIVDGYNYNVFGKFRILKKKERYLYIKMYDGSFGVSIMFDVLLMFIS